MLVSELHLCLRRTQNIFDLTVMPSVFFLLLFFLLCVRYMNHDVIAIGITTHILILVVDL